ncbi:MAG TPA: ABC transporter ATP-binding protein/permease [Candidatus Acutalibacter pullistercoris]|uniref:ABC transporter ATP-binding protein/permease n=1 Tax=Candidatus Acutalibacter pullistercoris TaxID=2838418 RepID=A0A9D1YHI9_9FIRM|nr:ABC transporter ATP-binding protein/permease [Candidatus Acutalibacter pullistercoris]
MIRTFARYIGQYKRDAILTPLCTALEVLMEILIPFVTASIIDEGIQAGDMGKVWLYGGLMLALAFLSLFFGAMAGKLGASASSGFAANLRQGMFENIQRYSFSNIDKFSTASLVTRMTTDVTNTQMAFQMSLRIAVRAPLMLLCSMAMCFVISPRLSLVFLAALVVLGVALFGVMGLTLPIFQQVFRRYDDLNASVQENVSGIRTVKAFVREKFENEKFKSAAENLYKLYVKAESILAVNSPVMMLVIYGCILAISWFGARFVVGGTMTTGNLTSLFSYVISMLMSLMMLSMIFVMVAMSMASFRRIMEVLRERPDLVNPPQALTQIADGSIDFDHVYFTYQPGSESYALSDIDLHIKAGETIGIIGGTGCGKSSLVNLISRLYDVSQGAVKVGGKDVRSYDLETLRDNVAVVLQKNVLFSGTILENLRWGKADATLEECEEACRLACADEFIERFPRKYDTWIDQGGLNVSGGQRQRLCIARALLKSPKVLILDDSTSAVDTATDRKIREAFARHIPGTTKLIISQRVSSIQDADRILVLENGKIAGFGTHEELLEQNKIYREIVEAQTQAGGDFDQPA